MASLTLLAAGMKGPGRPGTTELVVAGDFLGYLSPCGCTSPMVGGLKRWAKAVHDLESQGAVAIVVNGGLVDGIARQDELKAEALAESFHSLSVCAVNLTVREARLGLGEFGSVNRLAGNAMTTLTLQPDEQSAVQPMVEKGPFLIAGVDPASAESARQLGFPPKSLDSAVSEFVTSASERGLAPVLLLADGEAAAKRIAQAHPTLAAIVYRAASVPRGEPIQVGQTWLITPGERCKSLVSATWDGSHFTSYRTVELGPEIDEDPGVSRVYDRYLQSVDEEDLLKDVARPSQAEFAGSASCKSCHASEHEIWTKSGHSRAYETLESGKHGRDPDCVSCHVVGLESANGFQSAKATPDLAGVGCESCHGPAKEHVSDPKGHPLPQAGEASCLSCHNSDHSPKFNFSTHWPRIRHGSGG